MKAEKLRKAKAEAKRFLELVAPLEKRWAEDAWAKHGCKESGAVGRSSLDLSRALAELRKP